MQIYCYSEVYTHIDQWTVREKDEQEQEKIQERKEMRGNRNSGSMPKTRTTKIGREGGRKKRREILPSNIALYKHNCQ